MSDASAHADALDREVLEIFRQSGALLEGHFILRSGLHSGHFFQCAQVCQYMDRVTRLAELLLSRMDPGALAEARTVLAPAMGGLVIGQEVARQAGTRFIFAEKVDDQLQLRRGFKLARSEPVLVVEDVITRGGRVQETLDIVAHRGARALGVAVLVDRSEGRAGFGETPLTTLISLSFPTYEPERVPPELAALPVDKPGS
jgi:orotate phosphoribosyltransferase